MTVAIETGRWVRPERNGRSELWHFAVEMKTLCGIRFNGVRDSKVEIEQPACLECVKKLERKRKQRAELQAQMPTYREFARNAARVMQSKSEWAGVPIPLPDLELVIEPRFPYRIDKAFNKSEKEEKSSCIVVNRWWNKVHRCYVTVWKDEADNNKVGWSYELANPVTMALNTLGASDAWNIDCEIKALDKLCGLIGEHRWTQYILTGTFLETSKRSGLIYLFRKLRPTVVITKDNDNSLKFLTALCRHSIGYYAESWGGCMCPTDEVIAALVLMRGDEHELWRQASQHNIWMPQAGL